MCICGVTAANNALEAMTPLVPESLTAIGMTGWTSMSEFGSPVWMMVITMLVLGVDIDVLAQPQFAVRFMTAGDGSLVASPWNYLDPLVVGTVPSVVVLLVLIPLDKNRVTREQQRSCVREGMLLGWVPVFFWKLLVIVW